MQKYDQLTALKIEPITQKQKMLEFYWNHEYLIKDTATGIVVVFIAVILLLIYRRLRRANISVTYVLIQWLVPFVLAYLALYFYKQPNAKLLEILSRGDTKWSRDDYELYIRKSEGFFSLDSFDLNWFSGIVCFMGCCALTRLLWKHRAKLKGLF